MSVRGPRSPFGLCLTQSRRAAPNPWRGRRRVGDGQRRAESTLYAAAAVSGRAQGRALLRSSRTPDVLAHSRGPQIRERPSRLLLQLRGRNCLDDLPYR
jgi:hypothetical protein